jgi:hypothetical protein
MKKTSFISICQNTTLIAVVVCLTFACGNPNPNPAPVPATLIIPTPLTPTPTLLAIDAEDVTNLMGQPIQRPLNLGNNLTPCVLALYANSGTFNVGRPPAPPVIGVGIPSGSSQVIYQPDPVNTRQIPFTYNTGTAVLSPSMMSSALNGRQMELSYGPHPIASWHNETPTGPFATQVLPTAKTDVMFTVGDNLAALKHIFYVENVGVNVIAGNNMQLTMKLGEMFCSNGQTISPLTQGEVQIAYQKFGTPKVPYEPVPSAHVTVSSTGELVANIPLPQATMTYLRNPNGRPAPGLYYVRLRLHNGSLNVVAEISPAIVVWDL